MTPTAEQLLILEEARTTTANLLINARAGAAKTTTIELIAHELPKVDILAIAFNKKIADTLALRLPDNCTATTLNALGNRAWRDFLGKWPKVNPRKSYFTLREVISELDPEERDAAFEVMSECLEGLRNAKAAGYSPGKLHPAAKPLCDADDFYPALDFEASDLHIRLIDETLRRSWHLSMKGEIDFDDQIYMPALMPVSFPTPSLTMVDEAQDLSIINHVLIRKIVRRKRLIAVGDPCQAIYAFRGASDNSMSELREAFDMRELYLTICFRSTQAIIRNARWRAPDMNWFDGAGEGLVETLKAWSPADLRDGDAIICRNNAPLFSMAISLLSAGLAPELASGDILDAIRKTMRKLGKPKLTSGEALLALEGWEQEQQKRRKDNVRVSDLAACIRIFLWSKPTLGEATAFLEEICDRPGRIKLMTGHKAKGLEFDRVWFLDSHLCAMKRGQDKNIKYVIETRAKNELRYVRSDEWQAKEMAA